MATQEELQITSEDIKLFLGQKYPNVNIDSWIKINSYLTQDSTLRHIYESKEKGIAVVYFANGKLFLATLYDDKDNYLFSMELEKQFNPNFKSSFNSHIVSNPTTATNTFDISHIKKLETSHCKDYLIQQFPHTEIKEWKRKTKYKNSNKESVREFEHSVYGIVILTEANGSLLIETKDENTSKNFKPSLNNNYIFAYFEPDQSLTIQDGFFIMICDATYWRETKYIDEDIEFDLLSLFPGNEQPCDIDGSGLLAVDWAGDKESLTQYLLSLGFQLEQSFLDYCDENSGKPANIGVIK